MTKCKQIAFLAGCAAGPFGATLAQAQGPAKPQALEGAYRGMFVCEKMAASPDILHVPSDLVVNGDTVAFARPIFNWNGRRVLGSELGIGTVGADGMLGLKSSWNFRGVNYTGNYSGTLNANGGALSGTQSWQPRRGASGSRTCIIALVPAPKGGEAATAEQPGRD
jgi:hypothetical protein